MSQIVAHELSKQFPVSVKQPGLRGTLAHFFRRRQRLVHAVREVSFRIEPGEVVGFLGPNGAGKTTTLKMLTGLIHPSSGRVEVAGQIPFRRDREFLREITLVMGQKQQLLWDLPALDSLRINAAVYQLSERVFQQRLAELSELLGLDQELTQPVRKLSLGERMKAELLAALIHRPAVLFLDEPTLGLDVNAQAAVREFLRDYNRRHGATVILTSHYMADVTALCERVLLIHEGRLIHDGPLDSLLDRISPRRELILDLEQPVERARLERYGELEALDGRVARLSVERERLTQTVSRVLAELALTDLRVSEPPIEEVIGRIYSRGQVDAEQVGD